MHQLVSGVTGSGAGTAFMIYADASGGNRDDSWERKEEKITSVLSFFVFLEHNVLFLVRCVVISAFIEAKACGKFRKTVFGATVNNTQMSETWLCTFGVCQKQKSVFYCGKNIILRVKERKQSKVQRSGGIKEQKWEQTNKLQVALYLRKCD